MSYTIRRMLSAAFATCVLVAVTLAQDLTDDSGVDQRDETVQELTFETYRAIVRECLQFSSVEDRSPEQNQRLEENLEILLEQPSFVPLELERTLPDILFGDGRFFESLNPADRSEYRSLALRLVSHGWKRSRDAIDWTFDVDKTQVFLNVSPPDSTGLPSGVSPDAIKDPDVRREYEQAIAENNAKIALLNEQRMLRDKHRLLSIHVEHYLAYAYSKLPDATEELEEALDSGLLEQETGKTLLSTVRSRIAQKQSTSDE